MPKDFIPKDSKKYPFFKFGRYTKINFRFLQIYPLFTNIYNGVEKFYFPVQETVKGNLFYVGFSEHFAQELVEFFKKNGWTVQEAVHYEIGLWNRPLTDQEGNVLFAFKIDNVDRIGDSKFKRLYAIQKDIEEGKMKSRYLSFSKKHKKE